MDAFDFLGEQIVSTPIGQVALSLAGHDDGGLSVVAWLLPIGRRVGYLYCLPRHEQPLEEVVDPLLDGTGIRSLMESLLDQANDHTATNESVGHQYVRAGLMTEEQVDDLLGWQWLMAEVGQPRSLSELAVQAGLVPFSAVDEVSDRVERRLPSARLMPSPVAVPSEVMAVGA